MFAVMNGNKTFTSDAHASKHQLLSVLKAFKTTSRLKRFVDVVVREDDYVDAIRRMFHDSDLGDSFIHEDSLSYNPLNSEHKLPRVHRIRKQVLKLNSKDVKSIMRFHKHRCGEIQKETMDYDKCIRNILKIGHVDVHKEDALEIFYALLLWTSHLKDIYTLSRMLFYIRNKGAKTVVAYDGASHTMTYKRFFIEFVDNVMLIHEDNHIDDDNKRTRRCVSLPKTFVEN
jgi:hypothetical protein